MLCGLLGSVVQCLHGHFGAAFAPSGLLSFRLRAGNLGDRVGMAPWVHLLLASVDHPSLECGIMRYSLFAEGSEGESCGMPFLARESAVPTEKENLGSEWLAESHPQQK